ncbi:hypothetical protein [Pelagibius sp.]|uniref:hypothetical protein n=1 Tax=Pelagibius sp. TaxID=1931238 RepID=UPI002608AD55|nr:hypothetical protein [Pelagibius sp.]
MKQTIFTIVSPIRSGWQGEVQAMLAALDYRGTLPAADVFGFGEAEMLHFASLFLYDDPEDGWFLVFENNIDGEIEAYLDRLLEIAQEKDGGRFLLRLFGHCQGFFGNDLKELRGQWLAQVHRPAAGFVSAVGLTRQRIFQDAAVYRVADAALGSGAPKLSDEEAQAAVFNALDADPETRDVWSSLPDRGEGPGLIERARAYLSIALNGLGFIFLALINLIPERIARQDNERPDPSMVDWQKQYEDHLPTNHMTSVVHLHWDAARHAAKLCAFGLLRGRVTLKHTDGKLGPIETIHFAHWSMLNQGRRLLFVSNYGGSWDSYLDDFTLKASKGLTLAWAHGIGFPKSWFMVYGGAAKGPEFIDWARRSMVPSLVWYKAYPGLSAKNINRNRRLREALVDAKAGRGDTAWLGEV